MKVNHLKLSRRLVLFKAINDLCNKNSVTGTKGSELISFLLFKYIIIIIKFTFILSKNLIFITKMKFHS